MNLSIIAPAFIPDEAAPYEPAAAMTCPQCGGPIDVEAQMPIGSDRFATEDVCAACVRDVIEIAGSER